MKYPLPIFILLVFLVWPAACADHTRITSGYARGDAVHVNDDCEYRIGDSPVDDDGTYRWAHEDDQAVWERCDNMIRIKRAHSADFIWYRCRIPSGNWDDPNILILARAVEYAELYIGAKRIFMFGEGVMNPQGINGMGFWHMIPAREINSNSRMYFRVYSPLSIIGLYGKIYVGDGQYLYRNLILSDVYKIGLVFLYLIISLFSLGVFIARRDRAEYLAFSLFIISMALLTYEICFSAQLIFPAPLHHWRIWALSVLLGTPSMAAFLEYTMDIRYKSIFRRLWQMLLVYGLAAVSADVLNLIHLYYSIIFLMMITVPLGIFIYVIVIRESFRGDRAARIFLAGMSMFFLLMLIDYIRFLSRIHITNAPITFGAFAVIISMGIILLMKFSQTYFDLHDLTVNLGKKVEERTAELQKANRQLEKNDQDKTNFFTNLAHEIKTPLTLIVNSLRAYMKKHGTEPELDSVNRNLDLLLRDINNFFDIMKWEKGIEVYRHDQFVDISEFIQKKIELFTSTAAARNVRIMTSIDHGIIVKADLTALERLLNNLLDNALKYNEEGGRIDVSARLTDERAVLTVCDTGIGIDRSDHETIFLPYRRLSNTANRAGGIGMGLAIVKNIVESLDGAIRIEDNVPRGTCFIVTLPAVARDAVPSRELAVIPHGTQSLPYFHGKIQEPDAASQEADRPAILVVEDNRELAYLMKQELGSRFRVHIAYGGNEALEKLNAMPQPSLIISDIMMEGMDGFELLTAIRNDRLYTGIPFLFLTARNLSEDRIRAHELGALDYIYKPFYMEELIAKINSIIQFQRLKKEVADKAKFTSLGMLLAGISHEIFNPLSGISGPVTLLKDKMGELDKSSEKYFNNIEESIARIEAIIKNLKDLYGADELPVSDVRLKPVIDRIWKEMGKKADMDIALTVQVDENSRIRAHEFSLIQVLSNLFRNSIDAIETVGSITVTLTGGQGSFRITVADDGRGIKADELDRIFDPFYTSRPESNMGMGLFIVKSLAERMRWNVCVDSEAGRGTTVVIEPAN